MPISAYNLLPWPIDEFSSQYNIKTGYIQNGSYNLSDFVTTAKYAWNISVARVFFTTYSYPNTNIDIYSNNYGPTDWYGRSYPPTVFTPDNSMIQINDYWYYEIYPFHAELIAHELGHTLKLNHSYSGTLMQADGWNGSPYPTYDDYTGVNATYP